MMTRLSRQMRWILTEHDMDRPLGLDMDFFRGVDRSALKWLLDSAMNRPFGLDMDFLQLDSFDLGDLETEFSEDEVWNAVKALPADKPQAQTASPAGSFLLIGL